MFKNAHIAIKYLVIIVTYALVFISEYYLFQHSLEIEQYYLKILSAFVQCWVLIVVGFMLFQTFKYFRLPEFVYNRRLYESDLFFKILGVHAFRFVLIHSFFKLLNPRVYLKGRGKEYLKVFAEETKQSETSHLFSFYATLIPQVYYLVYEEYGVFLWLTIWSVVFNTYPILLQRRNRFTLMERYPLLFRQNDPESGT